MVSQYQQNQMQKQMAQMQIAQQMMGGNIAGTSYSNHLMINSFILDVHYGLISTSLILINDDRNDVIRSSKDDASPR